jgi:hypothetical protein
MRWSQPAHFASSAEIDFEKMLSYLWKLLKIMAVRL